MADETSLDKALNVLETIAQAGDTRLSTLAEATGYPPATIHRILGVLVRRRYVRQDSATRKYMLSLKCLEISSRVKDNLEIIAAARPIMQKLMERAGETVNLVCFEDMEAVYIDQISNTKSLLRMFTRVGARVPLHSSGVGKAFLAARPPAEAVGYFRNAKKVRYTENSLVKEDEFLRDIEETRTRGYAVDREEFEDGVGCIAVVITQKGEVAGAMSISGPSSRIFGAGTAQLAAEVVRSAAAVSQRLSIR
ncbi:MAG TPA: IclR family transcriptional regulator [Desulfobacterales bacterium]|nr:IclR family transcriptional regulator [Desulfobacterales bacterium]